MRRVFSSPRNEVSGFSLLEVVLALGIFAVTVAIIGQMMNLASASGLRAQMTTEAIRRAESQLDEVLASASFEPATDTAFTDNPEWVWSLAISESPIEGLQQLTLTVRSPDTDLVGAVGYQVSTYARDPAALLLVDELMSLEGTE